MSAFTKVGDAWKPAVLWQKINDTWHKSTIITKVGDTWKTVAGASQASAALVASVDPAYVFGSVSRVSSMRVFTNAATVTASGGAGGETFAWGIQPGWTIESPAAATTRFSAIVPAGDDKMAEFVCTVTDAAGTVATVTVSAEVTNYYSGGKNAQLQ